MKPIDSLAFNAQRKSMSIDTMQLNFKADTFEEAISQAIVVALGSGMSPREIVAQLIARDFLRDPGNNALEDVVRGLADLADRLRHESDAAWSGGATPLRMLS